ncbi:MAG: SUMF1/EgtB/PvdO family nonheme iron enzyme [Fimbriimonadaceae bacterium]|nr:SUMF1/EgtB/PvdO family nonheme iron enzyme [Fimbriimonadaceae bacterium]
MEDRLYWWGDTADPALANANWDGRRDYRDQAAAQHVLPVAACAANPWGLLGMAGNVAQWCLDTYEADWYSRRPSSNPLNRADDTPKAIRGGGWNTVDRALRVSHRSRDHEESRAANRGFRCANPLSAPPADAPAE